MNDLLGYSRYLENPSQYPRPWKHGWRDRPGMIVSTVDNRLVGELPLDVAMMIVNIVNGADKSWHAGIVEGLRRAAKVIKPYLEDKDHFGKPLDCFKIIYERIFNDMVRLEEANKRRCNCRGDKRQ